MTSFAIMAQTKFLSVMALVKYALLALLRNIKSLPVCATLDLWGVPAHVKVLYWSCNFYFFIREYFKYAVQDNTELNYY